MMMKSMICSMKTEEEPLPYAPKSGVTKMSVTKNANGWELKEVRKKVGIHRIKSSWVY